MNDKGESGRTELHQIKKTNRWCAI